MILPAHAVLKHDGKALRALGYHLSTHEMAIIGTYILHLHITQYWISVWCVYQCHALDKKQVL